MREYVYLDAGPLLAALRDPLPRDPRVLRAWQRARQDGRVTIWQADFLSVRALHRHPANVYGSKWWEAASA